jgi:hypothetical protein
MDEQAAEIKQLQRQVFELRSMLVEALAIIEDEGQGTSAMNAGKIGYLCADIRRLLIAEPLDTPP